MLRKRLPVDIQEIVSERNLRALTKNSSQGAVHQRSGNTARGREIARSDPVLSLSFAYVRFLALYAARYGNGLVTPPLLFQVPC